MQYKNTTVNAIFGIDSPEVQLGDFLFSDPDRRQAWADAWAEDLGTETDEMRERIESLYQFGRQAMMSDENRQSLTDLGVVMRKLARERHPYPDFHWVAWALDAQKCHMFELSGGTRRYYRHVSKFVPRPRDLMRVPPGGGYILIYTGPPESALEAEGARSALGELCEETKVFDVLYRKYSGRERVLYSTRARAGYYRDGDGTESTKPFSSEVDLSWFEKEVA